MKKKRKVRLTWKAFSETACRAQGLADGIGLVLIDRDGRRKRNDFMVTMSEKLDGRLNLPYVWQVIEAMFHGFVELDLKDLGLTCEMVNEKGVIIDDNLLMYEAKQLQGKNTKRNRTRLNEEEEAICALQLEMSKLLGKWTEDAWMNDIDDTVVLTALSLELYGRFSSAQRLYLAREINRDAKRASLLRVGTRIDL